MPRKPRRETPVPEPPPETPPVTPPVPGLEDELEEMQRMNPDEHQSDK